METLPIAIENEIALFNGHRSVFIIQIWHLKKEEENGHESTKMPIGAVLT